MFKFLKNISFKNFYQLICSIFKNFPLSALMSVAAFVTMVSLIRFGADMSQDLENTLAKVFITLIVSFFFSLAFYLYTDSKKIKTAVRHYYQIISIVFAFLFYYFFEENLFDSAMAETAVYVILTLLGVVAFLFIARYIQKFVLRIEAQDDFYVETYHLIIKIIMSVIVGIATMLLGFIALSAIFTLFDINFLEDDHWYAYWASFSIIMLAPFFFLTQLKESLEIRNLKLEISHVASNKFYSFLINYIGLPAIIIYFLILYAYTVKVLMNFSEWPQGEVTWMVILFSFFGYLIYFASYAFTEKFKHAYIFRKVLPVAVLLQTPMLFYAIWLRIEQYDLTINRYLVLVFGAWLVFLSVYYIFSRKKNLGTLFYSLLVVVIFMSIGPWSVYIVPEWRQIKRLENNLIQANILQNGQIVPLNSYSDIGNELGREIYGGISYLCGFHNCETLENIFVEEIAEIKRKDKEIFEKQKEESIEERINKGQDPTNLINNKYREMRSWEIVRKLIEYLKIKMYYQDGSEIEREYIEILNEDSRNFVGRTIDVSGYDYYIPLYISQMKEKDGYQAIINTKDASLRIWRDGELLENIDIEEIILQKVMDNPNKRVEETAYKRTISLPDDDMTFYIEGEIFDLKVVLQSVFVSNLDFGTGNISGNYPDYSTEGYILLKEKG